MNENVADIIELLKELQEDNTVPRNVKTKLSAMQRNLEDESGDLSLKVNQIHSDVEEISNDINLPMFIRTKIWELTTKLEELNN